MWVSCLRSHTAPCERLQFVPRAQYELPCTPPSTLPSKRPVLRASGRTGQAKPCWVGPRTGQASSWSTVIRYGTAEAAFALGSEGGVAHASVQRWRCYLLVLGGCLCVCVCVFACCGGKMYVCTCIGTLCWICMSGKQCGFCCPLPADQYPTLC